MVFCGYLFGEYSSLSYESWKGVVDSLELNRMLYSFQTLAKEGFQNQTWCNHCGDGNWDHVLQNGVLKPDHFGNICWVSSVWSLIGARSG